jgi:hypothetical protein
MALAACGQVNNPARDAAPSSDAPPVDAPPIDAPATKKVFISSVTFFPDLGGTSGADSQCQNLANGAGLQGVFRAWLSTSADPAGNRFTHSTLAYAMVDGTVIASNWTELISGAIRHGIDRTEAGNTLPNTGITMCHGTPTCSQTFTGTNADGTYLDSQGGNCANWTSRVFQPASGGLITFTGGDSTMADRNWTTRAVGFRCDYQARIYCFQQ